MNKYNKIYVIAPRYCATGGVELSHQLVDYLSNKRKEVYLVYCENKRGKDYICDTSVGVNPVYKKYNINITSVIEDSPDNLLVLPENFFDFIYDYHSIKIGCWWMSVDNRYGHIHIISLLKHTKGIKKKFKIFGSYLFKGYYHYRNTDSFLLKNDYRIIHFYQSYYACQHIKKLGFSNMSPLSDYINIDLISDFGKERKDIILYNPLKGFEFTKKIIDRMPEYEFVALRGLTREQLKSYLCSAKLYIDFGNFPGKDRLPREAAINGCCIITGKAGASLYQEDVPIQEKYKFNIQNNLLDSIVAAIRDVLVNYEIRIDDFSSYRSIIKSEQGIFYKEIEDAFLS